MLSERPLREREVFPINFPGRHRNQTGHTNRWQLAAPVLGDLLGQSQATKAAKTGIAVQSSQRTTKSADTLHQLKDDASLRQPYLLPPLTATRLCTARKWSAKPANLEKDFYVHSHEIVQHVKPDAILECMGSIWELHCPFLCRSETLSKLYQQSKRKKGRKERGEFSKRQRFLSESRRGWEMNPREAGWRGKIGAAITPPIMLHLPVRDPAVTKEAFCFALLSLYKPEQRPNRWGEALLASAILLGLPWLFQKCLEEMISNVTALTVCNFHQVSCKYNQTQLQQVCERWLELFLTTKLSHRIELKQLTFNVLLKTLRSPRLYADSEYELLRTVLFWIYLQFNPGANSLPSHGTVLAFFSRASEAFLEQPLGRTFIPLFQTLRLHGIIEHHHLEELQMMNVFPCSCLLFTFTNHFRSIHNGGNMHNLNFSQQGIRFGMIVETNFCSRTVGLYGFYFLLKASRVEASGGYQFFMERLRHWDTTLTESCGKIQLFSTRRQRSVYYQISVQHQVQGEWRETTTGDVYQVFGSSKQHAKSTVLKVKGFDVPMYVMFSLCFPSV